MNFEHNIILENDRALLHPIVLEDYNNLYKEAMKDKDLLEFSLSEIYPAEKLKSYIKLAIEKRKNEERYAFSIYDKFMNQYAGSTSLGHIFPAHKRLEIGWSWIGKKFQRTGLNQNCKFLLLQYAFETLQYNRVELKADTLNLKSRAAIKKIGGTEEGSLRSHYITKNGRLRDSVIFSLIKEDWLKIKATNFKDIATTTV